MDVTDRYSGFVVTLRSDLRSDDAAATITAIQQIKGVLNVHPHTKDVDSIIAEERAESKLRDACMKALYPHIAKHMVTEDD